MNVSVLHLKGDRSESGFMCYSHCYITRRPLYLIPLAAICGHLWERHRAPCRYVADSYNARKIIQRFADCTVIWKIFQNLVIHIPHNEEISKLSSLQVSSTIRRKLFLTRLTRICIWNIINFIENYRHINNLQKQLIRSFTFCTYLCS